MQDNEIRSIIYGLAFGLCGAVWIFASYSFPLRGIYYQVPLSIAFGAWVAVVVTDLIEHCNYNFTIITLFALVIVLGRIMYNWPASGHGVLAAMIAFLAPWPWLRFFSIAIIIQAFVAKSVGNAEPISVVYGVLVGFALAKLASKPENK
ncbi:MAG: hypothetical protein ACYSTS_13165 [Planctomycetota bacterium]|jgi:hypothetical protein